MLMGTVISCLVVVSRLGRTGTQAIAKKRIHTRSLHVQSFLIYFLAHYFFQFLRTKVPALQLLQYTRATYVLPLEDSLT